MIKALFWSVLFTLPLYSSGQIRRCVDTKLLYDGRELHGRNDSISEAELINFFKENKVSVGTTAMTVVGISICWLPHASNQIEGPFAILTDINTCGNEVDARSRGDKFVDFLTYILKKIHRGDAVFISAAIAKTSHGHYCEVLQGSMFILK